MNGNKFYSDMHFDAVGGFAVVVEIVVEKTFSTNLNLMENPDKKSSTF